MSKRTHHAGNVGHHHGTLRVHNCHGTCARQECDGEEDASEQGEDACLAMHAMEVEEARSVEGVVEEGHSLLTSSPARKR